MQFMMLLCDVETEQLKPGDEGLEQQMAAYAEFGRQVQERGILRGGGRLQPTSRSVTVRVREGSPSKTDGPFAETKEQIGGYFILECNDLEEALAWAAKIPTAKRGCVEVRPLFG